MVPMVLVPLRVLSATCWMWDLMMGFVAPLSVTRGECSVSVEEAVGVEDVGGGAVG